MTFAGTMNCWKVLTSPGGWWLGSSYSSASGAAMNQPIQIGNKENCKTHSSYLEILTHWLEEDNTAANPVGKRFGPPCWVLCSVPGPLTWAYREVVFNKCSQHCFRHPVWLHFSPKSDESLIILLGLLTENVSHALET